MLRRLCKTFLIFAAFLAGCADVQPYVSQTRLERGLVIVLPGIEGRSSLNEAICRGLDEGGVIWAIELHDWTSWLGPLYNLRADGFHREKTRQLAERISRYRVNYPGRPVMLVGQSGGSAIAIWTAESMPNDQPLEGVILLAAAISPDYMLDTALNHTRRGIVNFYSYRDWMLLGVGTTVYGTMDGHHTSSAGRIGFEIPMADGIPDSYVKLYQLAWQPRMAETGNPGMHLTSGASDFVATFVAPFVTHANWSNQFVADVLNMEVDASPTTVPASTTRPTSRPTTRSTSPPPEYHIREMP